MPVLESLLNKVAGLRLQHRRFRVNKAKFFKTRFFFRITLVAASQHSYILRGFKATTLRKSHWQILALLWIILLKIVIFVFSFVEGCVRLLLWERLTDKFLKYFGQFDCKLHFRSSFVRRGLCIECITKEAGHYSFCTAL